MGYTWLCRDPVLAQYVRRVVLTRDMCESYHSGCNRFTCEVVGQGLVPFAQLGMWDCRAGYHGLVVSEQV